MKLPFYIIKRRHGYQFYIEGHGFKISELPEEVGESLMDIQIEYVESHHCYMGGSPHSFFVEKMNESQAESLRNIMQYFFESHKLDVYIEYNHEYD
jgi:hypothetical protein